MRPEDIRIDSFWTEFAAAIGLSGVSQVQRQEMRKSFYAGFSQCFTLMRLISQSLTEEHAAKVLEGINDEAAEFVARLQKELT